MTAADKLRALDEAMTPGACLDAKQVEIVRMEAESLLEQFEVLRDALVAIAYGMDFDVNGTEQFNHPERTRIVARAALAASNPANSPNGEQTREQLLERLALTVQQAIDSGGFEGTLFESQVSGTLWLLYGEQSPASEPHEHTWSIPDFAGVYRCMVCGVEGETISVSNQDRDPAKERQ